MAITLPPFRLPMLGTTNGILKAFDVAIPGRRHRDTTLIGRLVEHRATVADGTPCLVLSSTAGLVLARLVRSAPEPAGPALYLLPADTLQVWEAVAYINGDLLGEPLSLEELPTLVLPESL